MGGRGGAPPHPPAEMVANHLGSCLQLAPIVGGAVSGSPWWHRRSTSSARGSRCGCQPELQQSTMWVAGGCGGAQPPHP